MLKVIEESIRMRSSQTARRTNAFTLIELLVVIAVIALIVGILLPALGKARLEGRRTVSLANIRSIAQAGSIYQADQKGQLPIVPTGVPVPAPNIPGFVTFGGWGKYPGTFWSQYGGIFDIPPGRRPLNSYLTSQPLPTDTGNPNSRANWQMPVFKDPSDKIGHQQHWDAFDPTFGNIAVNDDHTSCYDDVGTSYLCQIKWFFQTTRSLANQNDWATAWNIGTRRLRIADNFAPSRFIWINDEYCDITINQTLDTAAVKNGYGDVNKAVVAFLDGHARYMKMIPGGEGNPNATLRPWLVPAFDNAEYTVVFPDLRARQ
jgi:hypothetical protein